ncbi:MAG: dipeptide epimerase [Lewinellaceae bacterium]|nr:dipeptide epimerase [Lewinellaceae bacterium]
MKIRSLRAWSANLALKKPYTIAHLVCSDVENVFLEVELDNGITGLGAANPAPEVVGETPAQCLENCRSGVFERLQGRDIRQFRRLIEEVYTQFPGAPGTLAALDIALHDAYAQFAGVPVVALYGQKITSLPTSVTIGIMDATGTLEEAEAFYRQGFRILKIKTGMQVEEDIERVLKLHERFGRQMILRVDANQGYDPAALTIFLSATRRLNLELIEQPLPAGLEKSLLEFDPGVRKILVADESILSADSARTLATPPQPFGIFNIKLMKCGGIAGALHIAEIARQAKIDLFWGCNDESIVSITAALHAAFACSHTRYLDLDGSFDLAEDVVSGGFRLENGCLSLAGGSGLGIRRL